MDPKTYRAYEAVVVALRRMRPRLRLSGYTIEAGARTVHVIGGRPAEWADLFLSLERADAAKADAEISDRHQIPEADADLEERRLTRAWERAARQDEERGDLK